MKTRGKHANAEKAPMKDILGRKNGIEQGECAMDITWTKSPATTMSDNFHFDPATQVGYTSFAHRNLIVFSERALGLYRKRASPGKITLLNTTLHRHMLGQVSSFSHLTLPLHNFILGACPQNPQPVSQEPKKVV